VPKGKASLWAENCPNFLAGRKKLPQGKVFPGKLSQGMYYVINDNLLMIGFESEALKSFENISSLL
jgi:hypothetical protein